MTPTRKQQLVTALLLAAVVLQAAEDNIIVTVAGYHDVTVHVTNKLSSKMAIIVHCRSKDDDLGVRALDADANFGFSFGQNALGGDTVFWCKVGFQDKRLSFTAFDEGDHSTFVKDFDVSDDGVGGVDTYHGNYVHICTWNKL